MEDEIEAARAEAAFFERGEYSFFWGSRYVSDRFGTDDIDGFSNIFGGDFRFKLVDGIDAGLVPLDPPIICGAEKLTGERAEHETFLSCSLALQPRSPQPNRPNQSSQCGPD